MQVWGTAAGIYVFRRLPLDAARARRNGSRRARACPVASVEPLPGAKHPSSAPGNWFFLSPGAKHPLSAPGSYKNMETGQKTPVYSGRWGEYEGTWQVSPEKPARLKRQVSAKPASYAIKVDTSPSK